MCSFSQTHLQPFYRALRLTVCMTIILIIWNYIQYRSHFIHWVWEIWQRPVFVYTNSKMPPFICYILNTFFNESRIYSLAQLKLNLLTQQSPRWRNWWEFTLIKDLSTQDISVSREHFNSHRQGPVPATQLQEHTTDYYWVKYGTPWPHWHVILAVTIHKLNGWITSYFLIKKWYCGFGVFLSLLFFPLPTVRLLKASRPCGALQPSLAILLKMSWQSFPLLHITT